MEARGRRWTRRRAPRRARREDVVAGCMVGVVVLLTWRGRRDWVGADVARQLLFVCYGRGWKSLRSREIARQASCATRKRRSKEGINAHEGYVHREV